MIKSIVLHDIPIDRIAAMERWYFRDHAAEVVRRYGPWATRHESYLPVDAPADARAYGFYNWRLTEVWWREIPEPGPKGCLAFTVPPVWPQVAACFVPAQPTEDFAGAQFQPFEKSVLRWYVIFRYPEGVTREEGDDWFLNVHVPEVLKQPGLYRFFSYRVIAEPIHLPGTWPVELPPGSLVYSWDRVCEFWYETFADWRRSVIEEPPSYTRPLWERYGAYPFLEPRVDFVSTFVLERPTDEFWRDSRGYV